MVRQRTFSDDLREAIRRCGKTRYRLCRETGINEGALSRFMRGQRGMLLPAIDKLYTYLGLRLVSKRKPQKPKRG